MAYCTQTDIEAEFPGIVFNSTTSKVKAATLAIWIADESIYIDAKVGLRYAVPIDTTAFPEAGSILKRICVFRVAERVRNVIEIKRAETQKNSEEKYSQNYVRTPNADLTDIYKGLLLLKNVPLVARNGGMNSINVDKHKKNFFRTNKRQW